MQPFYDKDIVRLQQLLDENQDQSSEWVVIGKAIGANNLVVVLEVLTGQKKHIPYPASIVQQLTRAKRDQEIRRRHTGNNLESLAKEHKLSERQIREILRTTPRSTQRTRDTLRSAKLTEKTHQAVASMAETRGIPQSRALHALVTAALESPETKKQVDLQLRRVSGQRERAILGSRS